MPIIEKLPVWVSKKRKWNSSLNIYDQIREATRLSLPVWERNKRKWNSPLNTYEQIIEEEAEAEEEEKKRASEFAMSSCTDVFPNYIMDEILLRLPAKYLLRFRLVSKYWFHYITHPTFVKMHLNFQAINKPPLLMIRDSYSRPLCQVRFDDDDEDGHDLRQQLQQQQQHQQQQQRPTKSYQFLGSCNGLLCLQLLKTTQGDHIVCLWNPCTKEFKELPYQHMIFPPCRSCSITQTYGFGYGSTTHGHDYKVISNICYYYGEQFLYTLVKVYTLGTDSWKVIGKYPYQIAQQHIGVFVNGGGVYWLERRQSKDVIICFDFANEDYKEISSPPSVLIKTVNSWCSSPKLSSEYVKLTELKGFLCVINPIVEQKCLEVWAMNKGDDNEPTWSKLFTVREPIIALPNQIQSSFKLLGNYKNNGDEILVLVDRKELLLYNPKNDKTRALIQMGDDDNDEFHEVQTCIDSLVSLNSCTYDIL